ncbi:hypothetical protein E3N88_02731 [Mikania micrantha]|uniref:AMP-dependent synthetase/ligase domain-containing protein n=1 Tax=Mikania micrantha TaxID=192012 RepID=A0A5N6Q4L0_9ASTR|nr:hypothetical protein E3N88_02731 [Mikania micrantha]
MNSDQKNERARSKNNKFYWKIWHSDLKINPDSKKIDMAYYELGFNSLLSCMLLYCFSRGIDGSWECTSSCYDCYPRFGANDIYLAYVPLAHIFELAAEADILENFAIDLEDLLKKTGGYPRRFVLVSWV